MTRYEDLVKFILSEIVDDASSVEVTTDTHDRGTSIRISVAPGDMGKVIGKSGHTIDALRTVVRAAGVRAHDRVFVDLDEPETAWAGQESSGWDDGESEDDE